MFLLYFLPVVIYDFWTFYKILNINIYFSFLIFKN